MIQDRNLVELRGRLADTPVLRTTNTGKKVVSIRLATKETWKDTSKPSGYAEKTNCHILEAWGPLAELIAKQGQKGDLIEVYAKIEYRKNESKGVVYNDAIMILSEFWRMDRPERKADNRQEEDAVS